MIIPFIRPEDTPGALSEAVILEHNTGVDLTVLSAQSKDEDNLAIASDIHLRHVESSDSTRRTFPILFVCWCQELMDIVFDQKFPVIGEELPVTLGFENVIFVMEGGYSRPLPPTSPPPLASPLSPRPSLLNPPPPPLVVSPSLSSTSLVGGLPCRFASKSHRISGCFHKPWGKTFSMK